MQWLLVPIDLLLDFEDQLIPVKNQSCIPLEKKLKKIFTCSDYASDTSSDIVVYEIETTRSILLIYVTVSMPKHPKKLAEI